MRMARTLFFQIVKTNQFLVSTILFTNINTSSFNLRFDRFSIIAKKSQSNQEQCSLCCNSPCFCVLLCTHYGSLQGCSTYFRKLKEIGVFRPLFPDYVTSCDYDESLQKRYCKAIFFFSY